MTSVFSYLRIELFNAGCILHLIFVNWIFFDDDDKDYIIIHRHFNPNRIVRCSRELYLAMNVSLI